MAHQLKMLSTKPDDPHLISGREITVAERSDSHRWSSDLHKCAVAACASHTLKINVIEEMSPKCGS